MKVLMVNGGPHKEGCTYTALCEVAEVLKAEGIDSEIFRIGNITAFMDRAFYSELGGNGNNTNL